MHTSHDVRLGVASQRILMKI